MEFRLSCPVGGKGPGLQVWGLGFQVGGLRRKASGLGLSVWVRRYPTRIWKPSARACGTYSLQAPQVSMCSATGAQMLQPLNYVGMAQNLKTILGAP